MPLGKADLSLGNQFIQLILQSGQTQDPFTISNATGSTLLKIDANATLTINDAGGNPSTVIGPRSGVEPASYIIFTDGTNVYAKNGSTGKIVFSGNSDGVLNSLYAVLGDGDYILFTKGTYQISTDKLITKNSIRIEGSGVESTVFNLTNDVNAIHLHNSFYSSISGLSISSSVARNNGAGINITGDSYLINIDNVRFNLNYVGLYIAPNPERTETIYAKNLIFWNTAAAAVETHSGSGLHFNDITIWNTNAGTTRGFMILGGDGFVMDDIDVMMTYQCFVIAPPAGDTSKWGFISKLQCDTGKYGVSFANTGYVEGWTFTDFWASNNDNIGVYNYANPNVADIFFNGVRIWLNNESGAYLGAGHNYQFNGGWILANGKANRTDPTQRVGIWFNNVNLTVRNTKISNDFGSSVSNTGFQDYGIYQAVPGNTNNSKSIIENNDMADNLLGGINNITGIRVKNNFGVAPFYWGNNASAPTPFGAGDQFYNTSSNKMAYYNGTNWIQYP